MVDLKALRGVDFRNLDFSEVGAWPAALKALCSVLAAALGLLGGYAFALADQRAELAAAEHREQALRREIAAKQPQAMLLPTAHAQRERAATTLAAMLQHLPARADLPRLIEDISRAALRNGLVIDRIELAEERPARLALSVATTPYVELPIAIVVRGGYHQIGAFAATIAALPRLVTLHDFDLAASEGAADLTLSITANTYRYIDKANGDSP